MERDPTLRFRGVGMTPLPEPTSRDVGDGQTQLMRAVRTGTADEVRALLDGGDTLALRGSLNEAALSRVATGLTTAIDAFG